MNKLFRANQEIVEGMFSKARHRNSIGAFEGAMYQAEGYYRSEQNCIMFTRTEDFCRVCARFYHGETPIFRVRFRPRLCENVPNFDDNGTADYIRKAFAVVKTLGPTLI
jgi:hypothetical protein